MNAWYAVLCKPPRRDLLIPAVYPPFAGAGAVQQRQ